MLSTGRQYMPRPAMPQVSMWSQTADTISSTEFRVRGPRWTTRQPCLLCGAITNRSGRQSTRMGRVMGIAPPDVSGSPQLRPRISARLHSARPLRRSGAESLASPGDPLREGGGLGRHSPGRSGSASAPGDTCSSAGRPDT